MSPALSGNSVKLGAKLVELGGVLETRDGIIFNFIINGTHKLAS